MTYGYGKKVEMHIYMIKFTHNSGEALLSFNFVGRKLFASKVGKLKEQNKDEEDFFFSDPTLSLFKDRTGRIYAGINISQII